MLNIQIDGDQAQDTVLLNALSDMFKTLAQGAPQVTVGAWGGMPVIAIADNPAAGMPSPSEVFSTMNPPPSLPSVGLVDNPPDPATVFGGAAPFAHAAPAPIAAPVPPVPAPSTTPPPVPSNSGVTLDADGLPWDHRIHAESKKINAGDKKWKARRNVSDETFAQVVAELRAAVGSGTPFTPQFKSAAELGMIAPPPPVNGAPAPIAAPIAPPPPMQTASAPGANVTIHELIPRVIAAVAANVMTNEQADALATEVTGKPGMKFMMMSIMPAPLINTYSTRLDELGIAK